MKVESIAECSILQYFWPALSDNWSWKTIFGLFESGSFTDLNVREFMQVLSQSFKTGVDIFVKPTPFSDVGTQIDRPKMISRASKVLNENNVHSCIKYFDVTYRQVIYVTHVGWSYGAYTKRRIFVTTIIN